MLPEDSLKPIQVKPCLKNCECLFYLCRDGARLQAIQFGSISCTDFGHKYHSFVRETAARRWDI